MLGLIAAHDIEHHHNSWIERIFGIGGVLHEMKSSMGALHRREAAPRDLDICERRNVLGP